MNIDAPITKKKEYIMVGIVTFIVFSLSIRHIYSLSIFSVLDDEFGYWAAAAYLTGLDWSGTVSTIPYYSYGYSLLLVPLFLIIENPFIMYKAAILLNGLMLSASFLICYSLAQKLMPRNNKYILLGVSFLISMYPTYMVYSNIAWGETVLITVVWLLTWFYADLSKSTGKLKFFLLGVTIAYLYIIHQRTLGILIAGLTVIILMKIIKQIEWEQLFCFLSPLVLIMIIHIIIKDAIQSNLWINAAGSLTNDFAEQLNKVHLMFTFDGFIQVLKNVGGQLFYVGAASYLLGYWGIYEIVSKIGRTYRHGVRATGTNVEKELNVVSLYVFLFLSIIFTLAISVIFMINPIRTDQIVYGRYIDLLMGPTILMGFIPFLNGEHMPKKSIGFVLSGFLLLAVAVSSIIRNNNLPDPQEIHAVGLTFMNTQIGVYLPGLIAIYLSMLIYRSSLANNKKMLTTLLVVSVCFFVTSEKLTKSIVKANLERVELVKLVEPLINSDNPMPIFYLWGDFCDSDYSQWDNRNTCTRLSADCYQYMLKEKPLRIVNLRELAEVDGDKFVILGDPKYMPDLDDSYEIYKSSKYGYLLVSEAK